MRQHPVPHTLANEAAAASLPAEPGSSEGPARTGNISVPGSQVGKFERPRVRRLGALPAVTTAFGGSFTP